MDKIVHRKSREVYEGAFGGGSGGLFTFTPTGLPTSTFSTEEWEVLPPEPPTVEQAVEFFGVADHAPGCRPDPAHPGYWICTEPGHRRGYGVLSATSLVEEQLRAEWKRQADLTPDGMGIASGSTVDCLRLGANEIARLAAQVERLAESLRLTQEYVGDEILPPKPGWEWFDALVAVGKDPRKP